MADETEMMTLSTGEVISRAEWVRRLEESRADIARYWEAHPEEYATMQRRYIESMQRDQKLD